MKRKFPYDSFAFRAKWSLIMGAAQIVDGLTSILTLGNRASSLGFRAANGSVRARTKIYVLEES